MPDALVEQQPAIKAAQAGELASRGAGLDAVPAKMIEEAGEVRLAGGGEKRVFRFEIFGELGQVAFVGFAGERPQALFDAQIDEVFADHLGVAQGRHSSIIASIQRRKDQQPRPRTKLGTGGSKTRD